jgi:hypothetical protein
VRDPGVGYGVGADLDHCDELFRHLHLSRWRRLSGDEQGWHGACRGGTGLYGADRSHGRLGPDARGKYCHYATNDQYHLSIAHDGSGERGNVRFLRRRERSHMKWRVARAIWLTAVVSLFALNALRAQFNGCQAGFCSPPSSAPAGYVGPGDITSGAIAFYSAGRAYNAAYATGQNPLADLVDTATGVSTCTLNVGTNGFANLTATVCVGNTVSVTTFCTVTHPAGCSITKLYDQTGAGNHVVQATLANMPGLTFNAQNGLPCAAGTGTAAIRLVTAGNITQAAPFTETEVVERTGSFTTLQRIRTNGANTNALSFSASTNTISSALGGTPVTLTAADSAFHALLSVVSATAPLFAVDSSANTSTSASGTTGLSSNEYIMGRNTSTQGLLSGFLCEAGIWPADLNSSFQAMLANMRSATNGWNF